MPGLDPRDDVHPVAGRGARGELAVVIRVDRAWEKARRGARTEMLGEVVKMTDRELELVIKVAQELLRAADQRLRQIEGEKIAARPARGIRHPVRSGLL